MAEQPNTFFLPDGILDDEESDDVLELSKPFTDQVTERNKVKPSSISTARPPPGFNASGGFSYSVGTGILPKSHGTAQPDPSLCDSSFINNNALSVGNRPAPIGSGRAQQSSWYMGQSSSLFGGVESTQSRVDKVSGVGLSYPVLNRPHPPFALTRPTVWSEATGTSSGATVRTPTLDGGASIAPPPGFNHATHRVSDEQSFLYNRNVLPSAFSMISPHSQPYVVSSGASQHVPSAVAPRFVSRPSLVEEEDSQMPSSTLSFAHRNESVEKNQLGKKIEDEDGQILQMDATEADDDNVISVAADAQQSTSIPRNVNIIVKDDEMSVVSFLSEGTLHTTSNEHHSKEPKTSKNLVTAGLGSFSKTNRTREDNEKNQPSQSTASTTRRKQPVRPPAARTTGRYDERDRANQRKKTSISEHVNSAPVPKAKDHRATQALARKNSQVAGQGSCEAPERNLRDRGEKHRHIKSVPDEEEDREEDNITHDDDTATVPVSSAYRVTKSRTRQNNLLTNATHEQLLAEDESAFMTAPHRDRVGSMGSLDSTSSPPRDRTISDSSISTPMSPLKHKLHKRSKHRKKPSSATVEDTYMKKKPSSSLSAHAPSQRSKPGLETAHAIQSAMVSFFVYLCSALGLHTLWTTVQAVKYRKIAITVLQYSCINLANASKWVGFMLYNMLKAIFSFIVLLHKLALKEVVDNQVGFVCYTFCTSYRSVMSFLSEYWIAPHWFPQFFWICLVGTFCTRPRLTTADERKRKHQLQKRNREAEQLLMRIVRGGKTGAKARKEAAKLSLRAFSDLDLDTSAAGTSSERDTCPNSALTGSSFSFEAVRITLLVLWALETATDEHQGIIMELTGSEQVLVGFTLAAIKLGYICSPIAWISWAMQVLILTLWPSNFVLEHFLLVMGLSTLHLINKVADRSVLMDGESEELRVEIDRTKVLLDRKRK